MAETYKKEKDWFERDEHKPVRTCKCFCGNVFKSQARTIHFMEERVLKKGGTEKKELVPVNGCLSLYGCPNCLEHKIESFS